jgi:hypothetical protein
MATGEAGAVWARRAKQAAHGVSQEATVATIAAVPEGERNQFTAGRARTIGMDAAIESVAATVHEMLLTSVRQHGTGEVGEFNAGWNAARERMLAELEGLRAGLVAERPRGFRTQASPESLLNTAEFAEALYRIWAIHDRRECRWDVRTQTCTTHPNFSSFTHQCQFAAAAEFLRAMGMDPDTDQIPHLMDEMISRHGIRRKHDGGES